LAFTRVKALAPSGFNMGMIYMVQASKICLMDVSEEINVFKRSKIAFVVVDSLPCICDHMSILFFPVPIETEYIGCFKTDSPIILISQESSSFFKSGSM